MSPRGRKFQGDAKFAKVPNKALLSPRYAAVLRRKISNKKAMRYGSVKAGPALDFNKKHTSHLSVIDRWGNAVAMTLTINRWFGCGVIAKGTGILLNDEMDDFTTFPGKPNAFGLIQSKANIIQPGKTQLSSPRTSRHGLLKDEKFFSSGYLNNHKICHLNIAFTMATLLLLGYPLGCVHLSEN